MTDTDTDLPRRRPVPVPMSGRRTQDRMFVAGSGVSGTWSGTAKVWCICGGETRPKRRA